VDTQQTADWIEIFQLKAKYSWYYDTPELEKLMDLFTDDAVLDMGPYGEHVGREQIRELFLENISSPDNNFPTLHATTNPLIEVDGDEATGQFYLLDTVLTDSPDKPTLGWGALYYERYRREEDRWLISHVRMRFLWSRDLGRVRAKPPKLAFHADSGG
jgi:ketosteroid isomerase-like protein